MNEIARLNEVDGQFEFRDPGRGIVVRGEHPEWVLLAASEVMGDSARLEAESKVDELSAMVEFEVVEEIEVESAKYALKERFELIPQCIVTLGKLDYKWAAAEGRAKKQEEFGNQSLKRVHDMSLTRSDSFLHDDDTSLSSDQTPAE